MLDQYESASPFLDFVSKNLWLTLGIVVVTAVGSNYLGNVMYHKLHKKG